MEQHKVKVSPWWQVAEKIKKRSTPLINSEKKQTSPYRTLSVRSTRHVWTDEEP